MEKKSNAGLIAIIIILIVALLGLGFYVAYDKGLIFNNEETKEKQEVDNDTTEEEIIDGSTKQQLQKLVNKFNNVAFMSWTSEENNIYKKGELNDSTKLLTVLANMRHENKFVSATEEEVIKVNLLFDKASLDDVKEEYQKLYNQELVNFIDITNYCPSFKYISEENLYRAYIGCGGTGIDRYTYHINSYTMDKDNYYVYINVAYVQGVPIENSPDISYKIYNDINKTSLYKEVANYFELSEIERKDGIINQANYQEFSEYKYTFGKREDGSYYYKGIEKIR